MVESSREAPTRPITAIALSDRVDLAAWSPPPTWRELRRYAYGRAVAIDDGSTLFLFGLGAVVHDGAERVSGALGADIEAMLKRRLLRRTEETYVIEVDPARRDSGGRVGWDRVVIPNDRPELVAAVAMLLAQSVALERYELAADELLEEAMILSRDLAARGRVPSGTSDLVARLGRLTRDRLEMARWFYLVDRPEETWEDPRVAALYDALFANLELRQRHQAILHKLEVTERATETTVHMWHGRRSNALEWAIVALIVIEIVFGAWGLM